MAEACASVRCDASSASIGVVMRGFALLLLLLSLTLARPAWCAESASCKLGETDQGEGVEPTASVATTQKLFDFRSGFWINLHHYLLLQAVLATPEARKGHAESAAQAASPGRAMPPSPVYRALWWKNHDRLNRAWIAGAGELVAEYGPAMSRRVAAAFQTEWPSGPTPVEVVLYANWAGAYTVINSTLITISSAEPAQGPEPLEMLFHEASHALVLYPRRPESNQHTAYMPRFAVWIPAFAGMTAASGAPLFNDRCSGLFALLAVDS